MLDEIRDESTGKLPAYAWPGGYPIIYLTQDGLTVCPWCANKDDTSDPASAWQVFYEGPAERCDDCNIIIESAYGDPDDPDA